MVYCMRGSDDYQYLTLPWGSEAQFWQFYNINLSNFNFERGRGLDHHDPPPPQIRAWIIFMINLRNFNLFFQGLEMPPVVFHIEILHMNVFTNTLTKLDLMKKLQQPKDKSRSMIVISVIWMTFEDFMASILIQTL